MHLGRGPRRLPTNQPDRRETTRGFYLPPGNKKGLARAGVESLDGESKFEDLMCMLDGQI